MKKILYVEDEQDQVTMLQTRIESAGYQFCSALDGKSGLEAVAQESPDLILLDVIMPTMNGYEFVRHLKEMENHKDIPIIVLTASGAKDLEKKCLQAGVKEIMHKPYNSADLLERIGHYLGSDR